MVRLCSKSSRSYSGRPAVRARRQRRERRSAMAIVRAAGVSRGRSTREQRAGGCRQPEQTGRTHNSGRAELGRQTRPSVVLSWSDEAEWLSYRTATIVAEKECCFIRRDCQEPPDADPHVRWCGRREGQPSRRPDSPVLVANAFLSILTALVYPCSCANSTELCRPRQRHGRVRPMLQQ